MNPHLVLAAALGIAMPQTTSAGVGRPTPATALPEHPDDAWLRDCRRREEHPSAADGVEPPPMNDRCAQMLEIWRGGPRHGGGGAPFPAYGYGYGLPVMLLPAYPVAVPPLTDCRCERTVTTTTTEYFEEPVPQRRAPARRSRGKLQKIVPN